MGVTAIDGLRKDLAEAADPERAGLARYLQAVPGGYGEGDEILGVRVPVQRQLAGRYWRAMSPADAGTLLRSPVHEERLTAIFILVRHFRSGGEDVQRGVVDLVLANTDQLDNWDLVDSCAPYVLGPWLAGRDRAVLDRLAAWSWSGTGGSPSWRRSPSSGAVRHRSSIEQSIRAYAVPPRRGPHPQALIR